MEQIMIVLWSSNVLSLIKVREYFQSNNYHIKTCLYTNWMKISRSLFVIELDIFDGAFLRN